MRYKFVGLPKPTLQAGPTPPIKLSPNVTTFRNGVYNTGISEQDIEKKAVEDGQAGILDPAAVGVNSHPHSVDGLVHGHDAATGVIGHDARDEIQAVDADLEKELINFEATKAVALDANSNYEFAERERILQRHRMMATGLPIPSQKAAIIRTAALTGLFVGDWGLITLGYQVLGLSDHPWIPGVAFTDDLHLAALSSVFALVVLGEGVGDRLRRIEYALERRRQADEAERDKLPKPAGFDAFWLVVCLLGALGGLTALTYIRSEYLKALGADTGGIAFFGIQFAILLAAIAIGFTYANPESKRWRSSEKQANAAEAKRATATADHTESGSKINAWVDQRQAIIAKAGHHIHTDAANVGVQTSAYKRRYSLSQPEPVQEHLFGEHKVSREYTDQELLKRITGATPIPIFEKVTTDAVMAALEETRLRLDTLRARIAQSEINRLSLPQLVEDRGLSDPFADEQNAGDTDAESYGNAPIATALRPVRETAPVDETVKNDDTAEETA